MSVFDTRYPFISAYIKGEEAKTITAEHIDRVWRASSVQDVLGIIRETDVGNYLEELPIETFIDMDQNLWRYFGGCLERLEWFKPVPAGILKILKAYVVKYDVLNTKAALQSIITGRKTRSIPVGLLHDSGLLEELFSAEDVDSVVELLNKAKLEDYASVIEQNRIDGGVKESVLSHGSLDTVYYSDLLATAKKVSDSSLLTKAFSMMIDMTNLRILSRAIVYSMGEEANESIISGGYIITSEMARELLTLPFTDMLGRLENTPYREMIEELNNSYNATKSMASVEQIIDKHKFRLVRALLAPNVLSPIVVAWYLVLKEIEIRDLRLILKAMFDNMPLEEIRSYLVLSS